MRRSRLFSEFQAHVLNGRAIEDLTPQARENLFWHFDGERFRIGMDEAERVVANAQAIGQKRELGDAMGDVALYLDALPYAPRSEHGRNTRTQRPRISARHDRHDEGNLRQRIDAAKAAIAQNTRDQIAGFKKFLAESRAEDARPIGSGRDLQPYLMPGLTNTRPKDHPDRWATAIHEASHAVAATALGHEAKIESGRVNRNCSGEIVFTTIESIPPEHDATIDAAGVFTEMKIDASTNAARSWRTGQPENDRAKFDAALAKIRDREGNPVKHDSDAASRLINSAEFLVDQHYAAVVAIACLLYDAVDSDVGGEDIVLLYAWHEWPEFAQDRQHLHDWHSPDKLDRLRAGNFD